MNEKVEWLILTLLDQAIRKKFAWMSLGFGESFAKHRSLGRLEARLAYEAIMEKGLMRTLVYNDAKLYEPTGLFHLLEGLKAKEMWQVVC